MPEINTPATPPRSAKIGSAAAAPACVEIPGFQEFQQGSMINVNHSLPDKS
jgi:hypothetical protein